mgnify:CR=1 FL=1
MKTFVITIGTLCLISGLIEIIVPSVMRNVAKKILPKINNRVIGFLALLVGILFFYASQTGRLNLPVKVIGLLAVLKGFALIFGPADKHRGLIGFVIGATDIAYRLIGIVTLSCGIVLLFSQI